jgi:hypothetical protein
VKQLTEQSDSLQDHSAVIRAKIITFVYLEISVFWAEFFEEVELVMQLCTSERALFEKHKRGIIHKLTIHNNIKQTNFTFSSWQREKQLSDMEGN